MTTIKSFSDLEQSKKLAEILPLESADMRIGNYVGKSGKVDGTNIHYYPKGESFGAPEIINAWSLAALLGVMPKEIVCDKSIVFLEFHIWENSLEYVNNADYTLHVTESYDNPIDACYEMIIKLHELNLL